MIHRFGMDMMGLIRFCEHQRLAEKLKLSEPLVLKTALDEAHMLLESGMSPQYIANSVLTVLEIVAQNTHGEDTPFESVMSLEGTLADVIQFMQVNEAPPVFLENTQPILDFIKQFQLPEKMKLRQEVVEDILIEVISSQVLLGFSYERAADTALFELDGEALSQHLASGEEDFDLSYGYGEPLEKAIEEAYKDTPAAAKISG